MSKRKWLVILVAILAVIPIVASACAPGGKGGGGGTYIIGRGGDSVNLDLATATDGESHRVGNAILDRLIVRREWEGIVEGSLENLKRIAEAS